MKPAFPWKLIWEILSLTKGYRLFGNLIGARPFRDRYAKKFIRAFEGDRVLDIGCGPGDILLSLPLIQYVGFDLSPGYIEAAKKNFSHRGQFLLKSVTKEVVGEFENFDLVLANGLIHHLNDQEAVDLFEIAYAALKPGGRFVTSDGVFTRGQPVLARYLVSRDRGRYVRTDEVYASLARQVFPKVESHILNGQLRIPYTHIVMECTKA